MGQVANPDWQTTIEGVEEWRGLGEPPLDKPSTSYLAGLRLRGAFIWLRSLH